MIKGYGFTVNVGKLWSPHKCNRG